MALMMLCVVFNYTVLRNFKDSLIVNAPGSDAAVIAFLKIFGTTPLAVAFMLFYAKWVERVGREKMVYISLVPLLIFFALFAYVLVPIHDQIHTPERFAKIMSLINIVLHRRQSEDTLLSSMLTASCSSSETVRESSTRRSPRSWLSCLDRQPRTAARRPSFSLYPLSCLRAA